ncbi:MAG: hypothetical protein ACHQJ6_05390 [Candidatus Berkiellales bacterium]
MTLRIIPAENNRPHTNLKIEHIFKCGKAIKEYNVILNQNEVVYVCSQSIKLAKNEIGFLSSKNANDDSGILTLCSQVVHPDWDGRISAKLINIRREACSLRKGDSFLELMKFKSEHEFPPFPNEKKVTDQVYLQRTKKRSKKMPHVFLELDTLNDAIYKKIDKHGWSFIKTLSTVLAITSVIGATFIGVLSYKAFDYINDYEKVEYINKIKQLELRMKTIEKNQSANSTR